MSSSRWPERSPRGRARDSDAVAADGAVSWPLNEWGCPMTDLPRPVFQHQGPASNCKIDGQASSAGRPARPIRWRWASMRSPAAATAVGLQDQGADRRHDRWPDAPPGRRCRPVALRHPRRRPERRHDDRARTRPHDSPGRVAASCSRGTRPYSIGTASQSTGGPVNHAIWVQAVRGGTEDVPDQVLVYDPAADGRSRSWRRVRNGGRGRVSSRYAADLRMDDAGTQASGCRAACYAGFSRRVRLRR